MNSRSPSEVTEMLCPSVHLTDERRAEVEAAFRDFDADGDGTITLEEAHVVLEQLLGFSKAATRRLIRACDSDRNGYLSYDEFVDFYFRVKYKVQEMRALFLEFDVNGDGYIEFDEAKRALSSCLALNDSEVEQLVRVYDQNNDGRLQYDEFVKLWNAA